MLRVVMKPLITKIPLVGGLQIFFLNNPSIDFNLVGVADVLDMPGFRLIFKQSKIMSYIAECRVGRYGVTGEGPAEKQEILDRFPRRD